MKHATGLLPAMQSPAGDSFFIRDKSKYVHLSFSSIRYIKAFKNYIRIVTSEKIYTPLLSMKQMENELPQQLFCRVHRSYIVSLKAIWAFDHERVYLHDKTELPLSENYRRLMMDKLHVITSDVRQTGKMSTMTFKDIAG